MSEAKTQNINHVIKLEYTKCLKDPIYFMKKYVKIQHPTRGTLQFITYPFQDKALEDFVNHNQNIILKSRQMGITTLVSGYALWLMTFYTDKQILCLSIRNQSAIRKRQLTKLAQSSGSRRQQTIIKT